MLPEKEAEAIYENLGTQRKDFGFYFGYVRWPLKDSEERADVI